MRPLRPRIVYYDGMYRIAGPVSRKTLYASPDKARAEEVLALLIANAPDLMVREDDVPLTPPAR